MKTKPLTEQELLSRYKHVVRGTLRSNKKLGKNQVKIRTYGPNGRPDGKTRVVATSDLHQCFWQETMKGKIKPDIRKKIRKTVVR
jgi:hypothetical protein